MDKLLQNTYQLRCCLHTHFHAVICWRGVHGVAWRPPQQCSPRLPHTALACLQVDPSRPRDASPMSLPPSPGLAPVAMLAPEPSWPAGVRSSLIAVPSGPGLVHMAESFAAVDQRACGAEQMAFVVSGTVSDVYIASHISHMPARISRVCNELMIDMQDRSQHV